MNAECGNKLENKVERWQEPLEKLKQGLVQLY